MKVHRFILFVLASIALGSCASSKSTFSDEPLYLAHNLWYEVPTYLHSTIPLEAINYKDLNSMIPAGTEIRDVEVTSRSVRFKIPGNEAIFEITINPHYQSRISRNGRITLSAEELTKRTVTTKTFAELTSGLKPVEIENIRNGTIQKGMSKQAVLVSWGYPPFHRTESVENSSWSYWRYKLGRVRVEFNEDGLVQYATWYGKNGNEIDIIP